MPGLRSKNDKPRLKVQVWIWIFLGRRLRVLVLKTRKDRGAFWQPITGSVEKGEALQSAALREAWEETGLIFRGKPRRLGQPFYFFTQSGERCEEQGFMLPARIHENGALPQVKLDPREHTDYEWLSPSAAERKLAFASNRKLLRTLRDRLKSEPLKGAKKISGNSKKNKYPFIQKRKGK